MMGKNVYCKGNRETLFVCCQQVGLRANLEETKYNFCGSLPKYMMKLPNKLLVMWHSTNVFKDTG